MRVCIDTNVLVQLFGRSRAFGQIADALQQGKLELAVSNEILLEYEESLTRLGEPFSPVEPGVPAGVSTLPPLARLKVVAHSQVAGYRVQCAGEFIRA
jgi:predicted nucleic acid-binding protein